MRAPVLVFPRTKPSTQGQAYFDAGAIDANAMGAGIARGAAGLGSGLVDLAAEIQTRNDQVNKFKFLTDFTNFETQSIEQQNELKRQASPDVTDFPKTSLEAFDKSADDFAARITDPELQAQFAAKRADLAQRLTIDAADFQFKQQDAYFVAGLSDSLDQWKNRVYADKSLMPKAVQDLTEKLNAVDMEPADKVKLAQSMRASLEGAAYGNEANDIARKKVRSGPPPGYAEGAQSVTTRLLARGLSIMQAAVVAGNIQQESGFRTWAVNKEEGAHGLIQWRLSRWEKLQEMAAKAGKDWRDPNFQINFFLKEFQNDYPRAWHNFMAATTPEEANAALKQYIGYKTGTEDERLANAKAIAAGADPQADLTQRDDNYDEDMKTLNENPQYSHVSLEDRIALANAADTRANDEQRDIAKAATEALNAKLNDLYTGLHDGLKDENDINEARTEGWLQDIDDINKADAILAERKRNVAAAQDFQSILDGDGVGYNRVTMNSGSSDAYNKWVGPEGLARIANMDDAYMNKVLLPAVDKTRDIPTDVIGQLQSMSYSNDSQRALWAMRQLSLMSELSRDALVGRTNEDFQMRVDNYSDMVGNATEQELADFLRGGNSPDKIRQSEIYDKRANAILNDANSKAHKTIRDMGVDTWWPGEDLIPDNLQEVKSRIDRYARGRFVLNYRASGDETKALDATKKQVATRWAPSTFGGSGSKLVEFPIEKVYAKTGVPMTEYAARVRTEMKLADTDTFMLVADQRTSDEVEAYRTRGGILPTYKVFVYHQNHTGDYLPKRWGG